MTWFKVDDGFWSHPKTSTLSVDAIALWVRAGSYSCQHLTDGFVQSASLRMVGDREAADELVASGLWISVDGGWMFHDWDEYQETSDTVKKRRKAARDRQRKAREAREDKRGNGSGDIKAQSHSESRVTDDVTDGVSSLPPTRPDPTRPDPPTDVGACVPDDQPPPDDYVPTEIENAARPRRPLAPSSTELSFIRLHIGQQLPRPVEQSLINEVRRLRTYETPVIEEALRMWATRADARPGLLPHLVTDVLKRPTTRPQGGESKADIWTASVINPADHAATEQQRKLA